MLTKDFEEPLREVAYMNKEDHDGIFPIDNCVIELRSDDHTPPHIHWLKDGYNIAFYIKSGDFYKYGHGNKGTFDDLPSLTQNIKKWLKEDSKMSVDGKTNEQMCVQLWIVFHDKSDFKAGYINKLFSRESQMTIDKMAYKRREFVNRVDDDSYFMAELVLLIANRYARQAIDDTLAYWISEINNTYIRKFAQDKCVKDDLETRLSVFKEVMIRKKELNGKRVYRALIIMANDRETRTQQKAKRQGVNLIHYTIEDNVSLFHHYIAILNFIIDTMAHKKVLDSTTFRNELEQTLKQNISNDASQFLEMSTLRKKVTGLPVNIWVDDCGAYKQSGHTNRIKFQGNTEDCPVLSSICEMTIDDLKVIGDLSKTNLTDRDIKEIETFVLNNKELLHQLGNSEIDIFDFKDKMICNG